jgi:prefoldin beta subunit
MGNSTKIDQLQLLQQNLQNLVLQKQQVQNQLLETDSAISELKTTDKAYKIVGKIMLASSKENLIKDLEEKKEISEVRIKNFKEQESSLQKNIEEVQKEVMGELKGEEKENSE